MKKLFGKKIIVVSNITDHSGPTEGLISYLQKKSGYLLTILHPFYYCQNKHSQIFRYRQGKAPNKFFTLSLPLPEFIKYLADLIISCWYLIKFRQKHDIYIGVNCLHAMLGIVYRRLGYTKTVIFYTIDWMPQRFKNPFFNWLYFQIDKFACKHSDYVWSLSARISELRSKQGLAKRKNIYVPNGVNFLNIKKINKNKIKKNTLVLLGALSSSKGVDLIIKAMPKIWQKHPKVKLVVIGSSPKDKKSKNYEKIFKSLGSRVRVLGAAPHKKVLSLLPQYTIALAPYHPDKNNFSYYAWPARVIDYLASGLPVIITPVPLIAKKIAKNKAGVLINYHEKELIGAIDKLLTNNYFYWQARINAKNMVKDLSWNKILDRAFLEIN